MRRGVMIAVLSALFLGCVTGGVAQAAEKEEGWVPLFNGKDFTGWKINENPATFKVQDGMIVVNGTRAHMFYVGPVQNANFKNFEFRADVMTRPHSNSGIFFHTKFQKTGWPQAGYECQVDQTHGDWRKSGSLWSIADVNERDNPAKDNEWYRYHIIVRDKHVIVRLITNLDSANPKVTTVTDYIEPENIGNQRQRLSSGTFALQGHDPGSTVYFKNIMVKPLPDDIEEGRGWYRLFNGNNLEGWKASENPEVFKVKNGEIVVNGERKYGRCHLFYTGPVKNADFKNFELMADCMTEPNANSGIYFHTKFQKSGWPSAGYECQVNQTYRPDPKKSGSLYNVVNVSARDNPAKDRQWYRYHITYKNRKITIEMITGISTAQPTVHKMVEHTASKDTNGTFALQAHDPNSTTHYRRIYVKPLP